MNSFFRNVLSFKIIVSIFLSVIFHNVFAGPLETESIEKDLPNIVIIMADDLGWSDLGSYGGEISTPNLDALAAGGLRFTQFHNAGKCSTSRASLLTGLYAQQVDMGRLRTSSIKNGVTLAEVLKTKGYRTIAVGKHHGKDNLYERGFDHYWGLRDGATNHFNPGLQRQGEAKPALKKKDRIWCFDAECFSPFTPKEKNYYSSDTYTDWSMKLLALDAEDSVQDQSPFFLYLSYQAPHDPLQAWPNDIAKYRGKYRVGFDAIARARYQKQKQMGLIDESFSRSTATFRNWDSLSTEEQDDLELRMSVYAAMVDNLDHNIGRLIAYLKSHKRFENTLIVFVSDNGSNSTLVDIGEGEIGNVDRWASLGSDWANVSNTPLRLFKEDSFQGGINTPLIAHWPKGIRSPGSVSDYLGHFIDFMPTLLELSGATYPSEHLGQEITPYEGVSLVPVFDLQRGSESSLYLEKLLRKDPLYWQWGLGRAVRLGQWKLVQSGRFKVEGFGRWQLYDMSIDKAETENVASLHPERVNMMSKVYDEWWESLPADHEGGVVDKLHHLGLWLVTQFKNSTP